MAGAEEIGLLLVHGMGEQKKLQHLEATARELASHIAGIDGLIRLNVRDDTQTEDAGILIEASFRAEAGPARQVRLHLHEVWWADLGIGGGVLEQVKFWLWGLGQWAAQVVRTGTPSLNTEQLMTMPRFPHQASAKEPPGFWHRLPSRALLFGAALLAILTFFTWSVAKQVVSLLSKRLPQPSLIFLFLGDVKIYERPGGPGKGSLQDPDMPMRATIRRRLVSGMTDMAKRDYDRWYIFAHSLGTVPAFNALQETEIALPNYLAQTEWESLPPRFKTRTPFKPPRAQPTTDFMMPRRPPWLDGADGISRERLFERFRGLVTYGSPLDKFAALWPRVVPLNRQAAVFPADCEWINLHDPTDPVAARLDAFAAPDDAVDTGAAGRIALVPRNYPCRASLLFGLSHIRYLRPRRPGRGGVAAAIAGAVVSGPQASLAAAAEAARISRSESWLRMALAIVQVAMLGLILAAAAAALLLAVGRALPDRLTALARAVLGWTWPELLAAIEAGGLAALRASALIVIVLSLAAILAAGVARMISDAFPASSRRAPTRPRTPRNGRGPR